jgi:predicted ribosomally synthesized peptide with nif11-like leader
MDTTKGLDEFLEAIRQDAAIREELQALEGEAHEAYCAGFVAVGAKHGYTFGQDDVSEFVDETVSNQALASEELTDEQLELVAGGKGGGGGGAVRGIIEAIVKNIFGD